MQETAPFPCTLTNCGLNKKVFIFANDNRWEILLYTCRMHFFEFLKRCPFWVNEKKFFLSIQNLFNNKVGSGVSFCSYCWSISLGE